jgi:hypothetical protein
MRSGGTRRLALGICASVLTIAVGACDQDVTPQASAPGTSTSLLTVATSTAPKGLGAAYAGWPFRLDLGRAA